MIEPAPFLNAVYADMLSRTGRFLAAQGIRSDDYAIVWQAEPSQAMMVIRYDEARFDDGDYHARIIIQEAGSAIAIDTGLRMALGILRSTFDDVGNIAAMRSMASGNDETTLSVDPAEVAADDASSGLRIDDDDGQLQLANIEVNGHRTTLARSTSSAALEYVIAMIQYEARKQVGQRFAEFDEKA